ncbi:MAG: 30S ribosomal protein S3 [Enterobacterales bacterium]
MGQKVNPHGIRLGIVKGWKSIWYANKKEFAINLINDLKIRKFIMHRLSKASISNIIIERPYKGVRINIHTSRPGIVIGRKGEDIELLRQCISKITGISSQINISEIKKPELEAKLVADNISVQLKRRIAFRRIIKRSIKNAMRVGAKGIKVELNGRLGGSEIARTEWSLEGRVPLHTFRANIDYGTSEAHTTYGIIGIKVWIFKGEILGGMKSIAAQHYKINNKKQYHKSSK